MEETWELAAVTEDQKLREKYIDAIADLQVLYKNGVLLFGAPLAALATQFKFFDALQGSVIKVLLTVSVVLFLIGLIWAVIRSEELKVYVAREKMKLYANDKNGEGAIALYLSSIYGENNSEQDFVSRIKKPVKAIAFFALFGWLSLIAALLLAIWN